jgi:DNA mismatch repair ATPase MutL
MQGLHPICTIVIFCSSAFHDFSFNSSKSSIEFRDWDPILAFVDKVVDDFCRRLGYLQPMVRSHSLEQVSISKEPLAFRSFLSDVGNTSKYSTPPSAPQHPIRSLHPHFGKSSYSHQTQFHLTKPMLGDFQVINQIDKKFILCYFSNILCVIDQHAAAERVLLENFEQELFGSQGISRGFPIESLKVPITLSHFSDHHQYLLRRYSSKLAEWGWIVNTKSSVPLLMASPILFENSLSDTCFIEEYLSDLERCGGKSSLRPGIFTRCIQQKACRSAIKFGDQLTLVECTQLIQVF